jgi:hypothetical protein
MQQLFVLLGCEDQTFLSIRFESGEYLPAEYRLLLTPAGYQCPATYHIKPAPRERLHDDRRDHR